MVISIFMWDKLHVLNLKDIKSIGIFFDFLHRCEKVHDTEIGRENSKPCHESKITTH